MFFFKPIFIFYLAINEYIKSSKATQRTNASMLARSGSGAPPQPEKNASNNIIPEGPPPVKKPKVEIALSDEKGENANKVDIPFEGLQSLISGLNFTGCTVNFNFSK